MRWCSHKGFIPNIITSLRTKKKNNGSIGYGTSIPCTMCAKRMIKKGVKKVRFIIEKEDETIDFYEANLIHILEFTTHSTGKRLQHV